MLRGIRDSEKDGGECSNKAVEREQEVVVDVCRESSGRSRGRLWLCRHQWTRDVLILWLCVVLVHSFEM